MNPKCLGGDFPDNFNAKSADSTGLKMRRITRAASFDHLVGAQEERLGNLQSEHPGSGQIDGEVELGWLFDWQVGRLCAAQDLVDILGRAPEKVGHVCSIGHQASRFDVLP